MSNYLNSRSRRRLLKLVASGAVIAGSASFSNPLLAIGKAKNKVWEKYRNQLVIDGLSGAFDAKTKALSSDVLSQFRQSGITAINATIPYPGDLFEEANRKVDHAVNLITRYPEYLRLVTSSNDILKAKVDNQLGVIIGFQSTEMFENDLSRISYFADKGARIMQLSYNGPSQFGSGGLVKSDKGLTNLGINAIGEMERNKVLVDLSHSGKQTVAQAIKQAKRPITISHTGCNSVYRHPRNNDDAELKAVADGGGVVGIYLMPFLEGGDDELTAKMLMNHLNHAINICGIEHVSIGSDQGVIPVKDGPEYRARLKKEVERRIAAGISAPGETPNRPPFIPELNAINRMELIAWQMSKNGYTDDMIEKILGHNLFKLYKEVWR